MKRTDTVIVGGGQAGLAVSRCLTDAGVEHVVLERGRVAQRWTERWDSLRLLSPNWMTRLPGWQYRGRNSEGFMSRDELVAWLREYARSFDAPVEELTTVLHAGPIGDRWRVVTDRGTWLARNVVVATGHCQEASTPAFAAAIPRDVHQVSTLGYRNPDGLPPGGVLVVGASASGVQLARELRRAGREVVLSVGRHVRMPRRYRGRDIHYWLDRTGLLRRPLSDMRSAEAARREPSLQLAGNDRGENVDLAVLARDGVRLAGRLTGVDGFRARFAPDLEDSVADAERQLRSVLRRIDRHIEAHGNVRYFGGAEPVERVPTEDAAATLDLRSEGIGTVLWATGYRRSYPWLRADVFDDAGEIAQVRGRTRAPGLYVVGLQFMIRRNSSLIDGVGADAREIAGEIASKTRSRREAA